MSSDDIDPQHPTDRESEDVAADQEVPEPKPNDAAGAASERAAHDQEVADLAAQLAATARAAARSRGDGHEIDASDSLWSTDDDDGGYTVVRRSTPGWTIAKWVISAAVLAAVVVLSFMVIPRVFSADRDTADGPDPASGMTSSPQPDPQPQQLTYSERVTASGPQHYWKFELEDAGTDAVGGSPLQIGPDINLLGSSAYDGGAGALDCVGTTGSRAVSSQAGALHGDFSIEAWINTVSPYGGPIISFGDQPDIVGTQLDGVLYMGTDGRVYAGTYEQTRRVISSQMPLNNGQWHHLVATLSGTDGLTLYINGEPVATDPYATAVGVTDGYWRVCGDNTWGWPGNSGRAAFTGTVDEVAIYSRTLTQDEVAEHYQASGNG